MKILMICDFYAEDQLYQDFMIAKHYMKLGHEVIVITSLYDNIFDLLNNVKLKNQKEIVKYSKSGVKLYKLPYAINFLNKIKKFPSIVNILNEEQPKLIFSHGLNHNLKDVSKYLNKNIDARHIMDFHADYSNSANSWLSLNVLNKIIRKKYLHYYLNSVHQFFAITPHVKKFVNEVYKIPLEKIIVIPLGYDKENADKFKYNAHKFAVKSKFDIGDDDFVIITGGKFTRLKRTEVLIEAVKHLNKENIKLIIFGKSEIVNDKYELELLDKALNRNIKFLGWLDVSSTLELMSIADLAVYPASQSVLWQQSIGMDLPLIVGDSGGQDVSYLNQNDNILIMTATDINPSFLAAKIRELIENPDLLMAMKKGAKRTAENYLDYEKICLKTLEVFK